MKRIFLVAMAVFVTGLSVNAQLANTKWAGTMKVPQGGGSTVSTTMEWDFAKDTLTVEVGGSAPELFTFKDIKKVIMLSRISGSSQCPVGANVTIAYTIKNDQLVFTKQSSDCDTYKQVASEAPLKKIQ